jgi:hypothetical protein
VLFFREGGFYPIELSGVKDAKQEVADHVALNPGTLRVEDLQGNVLWEPTTTTRAPGKGD